MCGICGFVRRDAPGPDDREILGRMTDALAHRGPDDEGFLVSEGAFLGHRRLSIIDVAGGAQPMSNEDGRVTVVLNGEIYNHHELRSDLQARGHVFRTRSDTEVLVHLWEDEGESMLSRLSGMFALALWDARDRTLLLARDPMGKKPLFWTTVRGGLVFASELKSLLLHPDTPREVDPDSLYRFLTLDYVPSPRCILAGVRKVDAGCFVTFRNGQAIEGRYRDITIPDEPLDLTRDAAAARVWDVLCRATARRLESEVPLGVFLSGGLDSTAVLAAMASGIPASGISTFTIGFDDPSYDESGPARDVARHFGTDHHEKILTGADALPLVREAPWIADEPLADPSIIPTYLLSRFARQAVTVALSGDGGDELFYGYPSFPADLPGRVAAALLPRHVRESWLPRLSSRIPVSEDNWSLGLKVGRFVRGLRFGRFERHFAWIGGFSPGDALDVMHPDMSGAREDVGPYPDVADRLSRCRGWPDMKALACLYARLYLQDGVLTKVDRAGMAVGLEVRSPFLDREMVDLAFALPASQSLHRGQTKAVLRRMLTGRVPDGIVRRPKKGFGVPLSTWLRRDLRDLVREFLDPVRIAGDGVLVPAAVSRLVDGHLSGRSDHRKELFALLVFQIWKDRLLG
jgi:asparagine synthase (glutamine-hydrolysing)